MPFLKLSNTDISFDEKILTWKFYITNKALPTTKQVQLVDPKIFVIAAFDTDSETFVVHIANQEREEMAMDPDKKAQIEAQSGAQVRALIFDNALTEVLIGYFDYSNVFSTENATKLLEHIGINDHAIKLQKGKQPLFGPIYSLGPIKLETLKTSIETNLANGFIRPL